MRRGCRVAFQPNALSSLVKNGEELNSIVAQTGLSVATIRRRLMLLTLSDKVKEALSEKKITLSQAEALAIGKLEDQDEVLDDVIEGYYTTAEEIKDKLIGELPTLSMAIFPKEQYIGTFTKDFDDKTADFITHEFAPWLNAEIQKHLADRAGDTAPALRFDEEDPLNLFFDYPRDPDMEEDPYIKPFVRLEIGARGDRSPQAQYVVKSYIGGAIYGQERCDRLLQMFPADTLKEPD